MLNTTMGSSRLFLILQSFFEIMVAGYGTCDHDLKNEIEILVKLLLSFSAIVFNITKLLAVLQVKAGKTMIKE